MLSRLFLRPHRQILFRRRVHALPFKIDLEKAKSLFEESKCKYHAEIKDLVLEQTHVPLYGTNGINVIQDYHGEYGRDRTVTTYIPIYDSKSKSTTLMPISTTKTNWFPCNGTHSFFIDPKSMKTHIYGDFKYNPKIIESLIDGSLTDVQDVGIETTENAMSKKYAIEKIMKYAQKMANIDAKNQVQFLYKPDRVNLTNVNFRTDEIKLMTYYLPVFICKYTTSSGEYYKIINGHNGKIKGFDAFDIKKIASNIGAWCLIATIIAGIIDPFIAMPMAVASIAVISGFSLSYYLKNSENASLCSKGSEKRVKRNLLYDPNPPAAKSTNSFPSHSETNVSQKESETVQKEPEVAQKEPEVAQKEPEVAQKEPEIISEELRETFWPIDKLHMLGISETENITLEMLTMGRDRQLKQWDKPEFEGSDYFANANKAMINRAYEQLVSLLILHK